MPEYFGFELTEEELRHYFGYTVLLGLLSFSITITTIDFFRKYSIKVKIIIVSKSPQN